MTAIDLNEQEIQALYELLSLVVNVDTINVDAFPDVGHKMFERLEERFKTLAEAAEVDMQFVDYVWRKEP